MSWPPHDMSALDVQRIKKIEKELDRLAGDRSTFTGEMVRIVRLAIDEVIDAGRSGRFYFSELETTEKAYIGVRTEILFRNKFSLERGKLDIIIAGEDVDIKNTTGRDWMIPTHSIGKACLLIQSRSETDPGTCSAGLLIAHEKYMRPGKNQDRKTQLAAAHRDKILWLFQNEPFPANVLSRLKRSELKEILEASSGQKRIAMLFERLQRVPIPRQIVEGVARQTDAAKRVRQNGGARDLTEPNGLYILSADQNRRWIEKLGLEPCFRGEFISLSPETESEKSIIAAYLAERRPESD